MKKDRKRIEEMYGTDLFATQGELKQRELGK
jgi:hypothetical protein